MDDNSKIPDTVEGDGARGLYRMCNEGRLSIKVTAETINQLRRDASVLARGTGGMPIDNEVPANITLAYRCLEDASMRLGKALQALDGGVSVYDRKTTVGA